MSSKVDKNGMHLKRSVQTGWRHLSAPILRKFCPLDFGSIWGCFRAIFAVVMVSQDCIKTTLIISSSSRFKLFALVYHELYEHFVDNSDLLSCTVVLPKGDRQQRFLVADQLQLILVEPDSKRLGWAIVRFVGLLQVCWCIFVCFDLVFPN